MNSQSRRALVALAVFVILWIPFLNQPIGLETRPLLSKGMTVYDASTFGLSLILGLLSFPLIWKRPRLGAITGILAAILYIIGVPLDYLGLDVTGLSPPFWVFFFELVEIPVAVVLAFLCYRTYFAARSERARPAS